MRIVCQKGKDLLELTKIIIDILNTFVFKNIIPYKEGKRMKYVKPTIAKVVKAEIVARICCKLGR